MFLMNGVIRISILVGLLRANAPEGALAPSGLLRPFERANAPEGALRPLAPVYASLPLHTPGAAFDGFMSGIRHQAPGILIL